MSISERQQQILKLLEEQAFCTVQQLAEMTYISPSSIRRDLAILQSRGLIHRTHGGAALSAPGDKVPALRDRLTKNVAEKRSIAKKLPRSCGTDKASCWTAPAPPASCCPILRSTRI